MSSPPIKTLRSLPTVLCALTGVGIGTEAVTAAPAETLTAFNPEAIDLNVAPSPTAPASTTVSTSAATLLATPIGLQAIPDRGLEVAQATGRRRRRAIRRTPPSENYIGAGFNLGVSDGNNAALGDENVAFFSRIKLARRFSVRPSAVVGSNATFTIPATFDIPIRSKEDPKFLLAQPRPEAFVGGGLFFGLDSDDSSNAVGGAIVGGFDYPFANQLTANVTLTTGFIDGDVAVGALFGVAYRFPRR